MRIGALFGFVSLVLFSASARAGSVSGTVAAETFVHSAFPNNENGGCAYVMVGVSGKNGTMRGLLRVAFATPTPGGLAGRITVTGVRVQKTVGLLPSGAAGTPSTYLLTPLTQSFAQGSGCGAQAPMGYSVGAPCTGGATWSTTNCVTAWTTAGGSTAGTAVAATQSGSTLTWDSGGSGTTCGSAPQLCASVQGWIDSGSVTGWTIARSDATPGSAQSLAKGATLDVAFACNAGFKEITGNGGRATCTTCTDAANAACATTASGNTCNDPGPPSTSYTCTCGAAGYATGAGGTSCIPNACGATTCKENGDTTAVCTNTASGAACTCDAGFVASGATCVPGCNAASPSPLPCKNGGTCATTTGGTSWTCSCPTGYASTGGATPTCADFNACDATADASCTTSASGNACVDEAPPSLGYHCACNAPGYAMGTVGGSSACVPIPDAGASDAGASDAASDAGASDAASEAGASDAASEAGASDAASEAGASDAASEAGEDAGGAGEDAGGAVEDAGAEDAAADAAGGAASAQGGGCSCHAGAPAQGSGESALIGLALALLARRRKR